MKNSDFIAIAKQTLQSEADSILHLQDFINEDFVKALHLIKEAPGHLIVTGIGKSAIIGQKMVATLNSTGTPAIFMHAAEAIHGDLGIIQPEDVVLCISKSGNTPEISVLIPFFRRQGNKLIALVGNINSFLAKEADVVLNCTVEREACPNNLAPTCSSTAQLAMGDALASCLIELRGFTPEDFAQYHPGGILGKRLYIKVQDLYKFNEIPMVSPDAMMPEVILEISGKRLGVTAVMENGKIVGAITDGDLRRMLQKNPNYTHLRAKDVMTQHPKTITEDILAVEALEIMKSKNITNLFVVDNLERYLGVLHIHDVIKEGIV